MKRSYSKESAEREAKKKNLHARKYKYIVVQGKTRKTCWYVRRVKK